jgi:hypothetical protein
MEPAELEAAVLRDAERTDPSLSEPMQINSVRRKRSGESVYSISATRLVPVDDNDPSLRDVSIAVPVSGEVEVDARGHVARISVPKTDPATINEARAFTRNLIASGAVRGIAPAGERLRRGPGMGGRSTHEVRTDRAGRKVIRRVGFDIAGRA